MAPSFVATHSVGIPEVLRPTATAQSRPGSVTLAAPASSATAIFASSKSDSAKSRRTAPAESRRPATGINPVPGPDPDDPPPASAGIDGAAGAEPTDGAADVPCGGRAEPYGVKPPAGIPGAGDGTGAATGGVAAIGAAAGTADVGAVSIGAANDVIGTCVTGGTVPAADAPAARPRPKSIPSDGIGDPCSPGTPVGGAIPLGTPPKPPISPCSGPIGNPPPDPPPRMLGKVGKPPINWVNGLCGSKVGLSSGECATVRPPGTRGILSPLGE
ncbi:hypothetical protein BN971_02170 [Mycobacterium bohemicum DSM 44277]|uniref:Uncharacterized protein n=1 Tax=Mycobacterium bohemicum DSM 44277 TaxID=1236609 RepID=A0A0U0W9V0_MYCBE|nr:hypothetical protein BN971_02170 [Mycobacterium bohemicum DSM 44277]